MQRSTLHIDRGTCRVASLVFALRAQFGTPFLTLSIGFSFNRTLL